MTKDLCMFLVLGTVAMSIPMLIMSRKYKVSQWKVVFVTILLTIIGTAGSFLMFYF